MPVGAAGAEVVQQAGVAEGGDVRAIGEFACLPGVQGQGDGAVGEREDVSGEAGGELLGGDGLAAFGPGGVGGEDGAVHGHPVEREGAAQFG